MDKKKLVNRILWGMIIAMAVFIVAFFLIVIIGGVKDSFDQGKKEPATPSPVIATDEPTEDPALTPTPSETPEATATEEPTKEPTAEPTDTPTPEPTDTPEPTPIDVNIVAVGDVILYESMWVSAKKYGGGEYDFSDMTQYIKDLASEADLAVFNFEDNCAGEEAGYSAYPLFNAPDNILTTMSGSGFKAALFANNHTYDKGHNGFMRTQQVMKDNGLKPYGTRMSQSSKSYGVYEVNSVKIGILNYTYESGPDEFALDPSKKYLNGNALDASDVQLVDSFNYARMDEFYQSVAERIAEMKADGADFILFFIHWGEEYKENPNSQQRTIASRLCDMGVGALIGMHPHVVQPVETFVSADGANRMICYYSLGNFISAQNRETFKSKPDYAWLTENELMAKLTLRKYANGETVIANADYEPLWSHRHTVDGRIVFHIVPLNAALENEETMEAYGLKESSFGIAHATEAGKYIEKQVKNGIDAFNEGIVVPE